MSNTGEEYCRRDRLSYRQSHQISGAASATDRYHLPSYEASSVRHLPVFESGPDSRRLHASSSLSPPSSITYDNNEESLFITYSNQGDRHLLSSGYEASSSKHTMQLHPAYDLNDQRLPPLPPSPNHYVLDSEEPFIPPPDRYLSPPAPAPPDKFQTPSTVQPHDRFFLSTNDLYLPPASSTIDKFKGPQNTNERIYERHSSNDRYGNCSPSDSQLERYKDRYGTSLILNGPCDPYVRRDFSYHNHYRLTNTTSYYHQKPNFSSQRSTPPAIRPPLHNQQYQNLRFQRCCYGAYHTRDGSQSRDVSPASQQQSHIRSSRTSSPISAMPSINPSTIPVDLVGSSSSGGRYLSSSPLASTLPRCNSYGDVQCNNQPNMAIQTLRRTGHENCCFKRRTSSPSSSNNCSYPPHSISCYMSSTISIPTTTTTSTAHNFQQSSSSCLSSSSSSSSQLSSTWKSVHTSFQTNNSTTSSFAASSTSSTSSHFTPACSSNITNINTNSNVNSPSLSFSSSRSSPSLTIASTTNIIASANTSPTTISINSGSNSVLMEHQSQQILRSVSVPTAELDDETISPSTEMADDSLSSTNESLPPNTVHYHAQQQQQSQHYHHPNHRNPPASLPIQLAYDRPNIKHPLQHQISAPVTITEVASSRRYSRSLSKKEIIKNFIKKETAVFFGVHEPTEENERVRWLDRRKRLACRTYGKLKNEYQPTTAYSTLMKPDVLPMTSDRKTDSLATDERDAIEPRSIESTLKRKPSVVRMTFDGVAYVVSTLGRHKRRSSSGSRQWSRSYAPSSVPPTPSSPLDDEVFFDKAPCSNDDGHPRSITANLLFTNKSSPAVSADQVDGDDGAQSRFMSTQRMRKERYHTWRRGSERKEENVGVGIGMSRIWSRLIDRVLDNSDRREYGMGFVGKVFGRSLKRSVMNREPIKEQLEDLEDHRPFFTYWVTTVQILILALSIFAYGLGPVGFDLTQRSGLVLVTSLSLQQVEYSEPSNFWVGPRAADLIHMGAKFAPCMRKDKKIIKEIEKMRDRERETACCIRNDDSGCVQASQAECSKTISTWKKWSLAESGPGGRLSGSVCGLDPKFCEAPASVAPYEWPDDITKWPICRKMNSRFPSQLSPYDHHRFQKDKMTAEHMVCEVIGHPCCIGIHGTCRITTKEYCDFVRGFFHEEASLCSQVSCLDDVCGMIPFYFPEVPDQFYRLWTSLFIHAGILHLSITVLIQYFLMRDLEKLTGAIRIGFIYIGSGVAGNLASAIFVPYRADVGPAGSQFGLLACLIVEVLNCWPMLKHPFQALMKLLIITFLLFLFGLLPWVDNFAHLFGFIFGFLLSYALLPFVSFGPYDRQKKIFLIWVCLLSSLFLFVLLVLLFYLIPIYDCEVCHYFNCIPLTRDFCATQNINFKREEYVV